jgi:hypothetical protein
MDTPYKNTVVIKGRIVKYIELFSLFTRHWHIAQCAVIAK